jgi:hypothetical protein
MATDHEVWNDVETITYFSKTAERPPATGAAVQGTLWMAIRKDRLKADSLRATMDMTVNLPKATLGGIVPKDKDIMQRGDGTRWVIMLVEIVASAQEYRVHVNQNRKGT